MIADVQHDPRTQRRGRIVIVTMIVGFLVVCAALGWFLVHREQEEARLAELTRPGLLTVGVPPLELEIEELSALPDHRGLVATYRHSDGEAVSQLRLLNLRAGSDPNLCELLIGVAAIAGALLVLAMVGSGALAGAMSPGWTSPQRPWARPRSSKRRGNCGRAPWSCSWATRRPSTTRGCAPTSTRPS